MGSGMRLSYNPETHRRCVCCRPIGGQYPLVAVLVVAFPNGAVLLDCGHIAQSFDEFREWHPEWTWVA
jgi:hypothetical protein